MSTTPGGGILGGFGGKWKFPIMYQVYSLTKKTMFRLPLIIPTNSVVPAWATGFTPNSATTISFTTSAGVGLSIGGPTTDGSGNIQSFQVTFGTNIPNGKTTVKLTDAAGKSATANVNVGGFSLGVGAGGPGGGLLLPGIHHETLPDISPNRRNEVNTPGVLAKSNQVDISATYRK